MAKTTTIAPENTTEPKATAPEAAASPAPADAPASSAPVPSPASADEVAELREHAEMALAEISTLKSQVAELRAAVLTLVDRLRDSPTVASGPRKDAPISIGRVVLYTFASGDERPARVVRVLPEGRVSLVVDLDAPNDTSIIEPHERSAAHNARTACVWRGTVDRNPEPSEAKELTWRFPPRV